MKTIFTDKGWEQYLEWFRSGDKKAVKKINDLIEDIKKNGLLAGTGQPEQLKYFDEVRYSRRINQGDRLVYFLDENSDLVIQACRGHYEE
ncbi:Txe/YoeB family addiction module toxin [Eubacteriales bacterium OttesenSCG-928-A19]|nr:Txe/YoeB family addiction module toxin [Eubacteriales bacterium OttesenSCG-928-A19]